MRIEDFPWNVPESRDYLHIEEFCYYAEYLGLEITNCYLEYVSDGSALHIKYDKDKEYTIELKGIATRRELYDKMLIGLGYIAGLVDA